MSVKRDRQKKKNNIWSREFCELVAGFSGGFLFGTPLLYTMEVWFIGSHVEPPLLLVILAINYILVFLFNRAEGFRPIRTHRLADAATESVEAVAIGIICASFTLILLQRIAPDTPLDEALGKIIFESVPCSLGVALSRSILTGNREGPKDSENPQSNDIESPKKRKNQINLTDTFSDLNATMIGAIIIAFNIAPTDEVPMLAAAASPPWLLAIIAASLVISYGIVFAAGFTNQQKRRQQRGLFQSPIGETIFSYLVSLLASMAMLSFFQHLSFDDPWSTWLRYGIILSLPATVGGAAGRLAS